MRLSDKVVNQTEVTTFRLSGICATSSAPVGCAYKYNSTRVAWDEYTRNNSCEPEALNRAPRLRRSICASARASPSTSTVSKTISFLANFRWMVNRAHQLTKSSDVLLCTVTSTFGLRPRGWMGCRVCGGARGQELQY